MKPIYSFFFNTRRISLLQKKDLTLIQVAELVSITIPRFCYHSELSIAGNCRMCLIEVIGSLKPVIACGAALAKDINIITNSKKVAWMREGVIELILINHPLDCPICDSAGECDLQDISLLFGNDLSRFREKKRTVSDKNFGPFIKTIMTRCIHCTRCIRFIDEYLFNGEGHIGTLGRGVGTEVANYYDHSFDHDLSGNLADICPVGALTHKTYAFTARPWDLHSIESVDFVENLTMHIRVDTKGNDVYRIMPSYTLEYDNEFISNKSRYFYDITFNNYGGYGPFLTVSNHTNAKLLDASHKLIWALLPKHASYISYKATTLDASQTHMLKLLSLFSDFRTISAKNSSDLRPNYLQEHFLNQLSKNITVGFINLKLESSLFLLQLKKLKASIYYIGSSHYDTYDSQIGISNNAYSNFIQGRFEYSQQCSSIFHPKTIVREDTFENIFTNYLNTYKYITDLAKISILEAGLFNHFTRQENKFLKKQHTILFELESNTMSMKYKYPSHLHIIQSSSYQQDVVDSFERTNYKKKTFIIPSKNPLSEYIIFYDLKGVKKGTSLIYQSISHNTHQLGSYCTRELTRVKSSTLTLPLTNFPTTPTKTLNTFTFNKKKYIDNTLEYFITPLMVKRMMYKTYLCLSTISLTSFISQYTLLKNMVAVVSFITLNNVPFTNNASYMESSLFIKRSHYIQFAYEDNDLRRSPRKPKRNYSKEFINETTLRYSKTIVKESYLFARALSYNLASYVLNITRYQH